MTMLRFIANGQVDGFLKDINSAVMARWKIVDSLKGATFNVGDTVRVNGESRRYRGRTGVVIAKSGKWIRVETTSPYGMKEVIGFTPGLLELAA